MIKNKDGFTLVEIIITLGILGIVLLFTSSFFAYGLRVYNTSENRVNSQFDVRAASDLILREVKNAHEIYVNEPEKPDDYHKIFLENNILKYVNPEGKVVSRTSNNIDDIDFEIKKNKNKFILTFEINADLKTNSNFSIKSDVVLNNIFSAKTELEKGKQIYYKKTGAFEEESESINLEKNNNTVLIDKFTVVFDFNKEDETYTTIQVYENQNITNFPEDPQKDGCEFLGWNTRRDGTGAEVNVFTEILSDMTVYAKWSENQNQELEIKNPDNIEIPKGTTYEFIPDVVGGLNGYIINYFAYSYDGYYFVEDNNLTWDPQNSGKGKKIDFKITVFDGSGSVVEKDITIITR
jgi:prepilin-type N-terminal cleavage/methylation domain-containing protein